MDERRSVPTVSVLMPVRDGERFLGAALDSIFAQTFPDFELVVVDDGSRDGTAASLAACRDPRLTVITHAEPQGVPRSLNHGLARCRGRFIARMDADDVAAPERLARQVAWLDAPPECGVVATLVERIDADGRAIAPWVDDRAALTRAEIRRLMPSATCIAHSSVMARRAVFERHRYRAASPRGQDWELWMRLLAHGVVIDKIPEVLMRIRFHGANTGRWVNRLETLVSRDAHTRAVFLGGALAERRFGAVEREVLWRFGLDLARAFGMVAPRG